jgi:nucleotide-binding universal stress UspA family protein
MNKILLAVDNSEGSLSAVQAMIATAGLYKEPLEVELVTVVMRSPRVAGLASMAISQDEVDRFHREQGEEALAASKALLDKAGIRHSGHVLAGEVAQSIVSHAKDNGCRLIVMGTRGLGALAGLALGSVATKVLHLAPMPVMLVR